MKKKLIIHSLFLICFVLFVFLMIELIPRSVYFQHIDYFNDITKNRIPLESMLFIYITPLLLSLLIGYYVVKRNLKSYLMIILVPCVGTIFIYLISFFMNIILDPLYYNIFNHPRGSPYFLFCFASTFFCFIYSIILLFLKKIINKYQK